MAMTFGGPSHAKFSTSNVKAPANSMTAAYDLDGDGLNDNRLGSILSGLAALNLNVQPSIDFAVKSGQLLVLFDLSSKDPSMLSDPTAAVTVELGQQPASPPNYDGTDTFVIDAMTTAPAHLTGTLSAGSFESQATSTATIPVSTTIKLPIIPGSPPIALPLTALHVSFTRSSGGDVSTGQINGAIMKSDIDTSLYPALAAMLTTQVQTPGASPAILMFDTNMDGTVTVDELKMNALITNFLAPDVQLYQNGVYKPNPAKTTKDALSCGLAFTGVPAGF
jgi:hypothetical protein